MKKFLSVLFVSFLVLCSGCSKQENPFQVQEISVDEIQEKMNAKESFLFVVIRENCPYCEKLEEYIEKTKKEHPGYTLYQLDCTNFELYKEENGSLQAKSEQGKAFIEMAPSFQYTPSFYAVQKGEIQSSAVGYEPDIYKVNLWNKLDEVIDFDKAELEDVWDYIEQYAWENLNERD